MSGKSKSVLCDASEPDYEKVVSEHFRRQKFINFIGAELLRILPGFCTLRLKYRKEITDAPLCFHPGVIGAVATSAGELAALTLLPRDSFLATTEYKLNLMSPAQGNALIAQAKVIKSAKTATVCIAEVYARKARTQSLCAIALMTFVPG